MKAPSAAGPLFIVLNAGSGSQDQEARLQLIDAAMQRAGRRHQMLLFDRQRPITDVAAQAVASAKAEDGVVVAAGGDGTINAVAQAAIGSGCAFGVLPQGTFNYFGRTHGIPEETDAALELLLTGTPTPVQAGRVNGKIFLVNASLGLYPQLLEDREGFKNRYGRSRFNAMISAVFSIMREHRQLVLTVDWTNDAAVGHASATPTADSGPRILKTPTLFVGNNRLQLEQIGIELAPELDRGRLVAIAPRAIGTLAMFGLALRGALGQLGEADSVRSLAFERLRVAPLGRLGRRRLKLATDGEISRMRPPFDFDISEQPLWLIKRAEPVPAGDPSDAS